MKSKLDIIEERLQALIEGSPQFFPRENVHQVLAKRLVAALQESSIIREDGSYSAPGLFIIHLNQKNYLGWQAEVDFLTRVAKILQEAAIEEEVHFEMQPVITLQEDDTLQENDLYITAERNPIHHEYTAAIKIKASEEKPSRPLTAFIIVNGSEVIPLRQSVVNIGRRLENHIVINDPRVSRSHAQLRSSKGSYVIFDLNSTGGTYVNGQRISQQVLKPGDVISLAGVSIIYGEEISAEMGDTTDLNARRQPPADSSQIEHDSQE